MQTSVHIIPSSNRWAVRKTGAAKALRVFETREEALDYGKKISIAGQTALYVHNKNGTINDFIRHPVLSSKKRTLLHTA